MGFALPPVLLAAVPGSPEVLVTLAALVIATGVFWWWLVQRLSALTPPAAAPAPEPEPEAAPEPPPVEGPGALLARYQALTRELEEVTKDLQRFSGTREVQLQGWQQLSSDILRRILPVLDNIAPFLDDDDETVATVAHMVHGRLLTELATVGVTVLRPAPGETFDGRYHQLGPETTGYPPYRIKAVVAPGYLFTARVPGAGEVVLKPAEVVGESRPVVDEEAPLEPAATGAEEA